METLAAMIVTSNFNSFNCAANINDAEPPPIMAIGNGLQELVAMQHLILEFSILPNRLKSLIKNLAAQKKQTHLLHLNQYFHKLPLYKNLLKIGALKNKSKVILDYAHTPDALNTCLSNLKEQFENKRIFIVFGCGGNRDKDKRPMMGKIANQYCDRVYLTDDNPRDENPKKIRLAIKKTIDKSKVFEISNRSKAIHKAIFDLNTGDILVIAGKGHEQTQDYGKFVNKFSDRLEILQNIKLKNKILSTNLKINILKEISNSPQINSNIKINNASINSKTINKNDIFFAIKGNNKDGNLYVNEAIQNGASLVIANNQKKSKKKIIVDNTLQLLTEASSKLRENLSSKIISITGSCTGLFISARVSPTSIFSTPAIETISPAKASSISSLLLECIIIILPTRSFFPLVEFNRASPFLIEPE